MMPAKANNCHMCAASARIGTPRRRRYSTRFLVFSLLVIRFS